MRWGFFFKPKLWIYGLLIQLFFSFPNVPGFIKFEAMSRPVRRFPPSWKWACQKTSVSRSQNEVSFSRLTIVIMEHSFFSVRKCISLLHHQRNRCHQNLPDTLSQWGNQAGRHRTLQGPLGRWRYKGKQVIFDSLMLLKKDHNIWCTKASAVASADFNYGSI